MDSQLTNTASSPPEAAKVDHLTSVPGQDGPTQEGSSRLSVSSISSWAKSIKIPSFSNQEDAESGGSAKSSFSRFASGFVLRTSPRSPTADETGEGTPTAAQPSVLGNFTKGLVDSSKNAMKVVQTKARHMVSQNKRRYQEDGFDLDMTYITENIIAMGFPAGDISSGIFGYVEGFYRNHMEEVMKFFDTHHKGKYKVYNLCSERLYDASLFEGKVACFPFDDHNCPPIQLIISFCQSAYAWLKEDIENVVVVHCKAGMARTGLMISSLLLYLKFFPTAEESISYYNQKRCVDGKGLVLPSQIRYVKYFERILTYFNGENQPGRRCILRGFRLHRCPYWVRPSITVSDHNGVLFSTKKHPRTKSVAPEEFWFTAPRKGIMVFALPGERGLAELAGDFKVHFHDRQGDFYCWLNTTMMENRKTLTTSELDGFDKRKLPSPGFMVEVVLMDCDAPLPTREKKEEDSQATAGKPEFTSTHGDVPPVSTQGAGNQEKDDVFSDSESEEGREKGRHSQAATDVAESIVVQASGASEAQKETETMTHGIAHVSVSNDSTNPMSVQDSKSANKARDSSEFEAPKVDTEGISDFKAIAADASVFTFGDDEDYESE
ncbi:phosphatidylinositol 3,4,5-trisphosphate 3-phosphatase and protein-tyrosine-phosphatase PTEN2A-like [Nymphaea colorata]|nr:phosphatidylinositol 3,4,5-trisphosphate 3-phosphatase and protein-tyrosine-phosphatase PTEN2A-like [Nymphaea colorata]XP_031480075.1 phosphatidylinositol 3,4,5-trisphosphate 3-phosphatase and protein-tyrosine-phosphatase PTEN2A-like [Nymphaea colorata]